MPYCTYCGEELEPETVRYAIITEGAGYDRDTGKPNPGKVTCYRVVTSGCHGYYNDAAYPETAQYAHLHEHIETRTIVRRKDIPKGAEVFFPPPDWR